MDSNALKSLRKASRPALGRGLSALISSSPVTIVPTKFEQSAAPVTPQSNVVENQDLPSNPIQNSSSTNLINYLPLSALKANKQQPRTYFSEVEIAELANSIKQHGVLQPILVRPTKIDGIYEIVAGERRFRAAQHAELISVPVIIKELSERDTLEVSIIENVQREDLNPIEEAKSYQRLMDEFSLTANEVAEKVGKDRATVANIVRILKLQDGVKEMLKDGSLSLGHAKAILTVKEPVAQLGLAKKVVEERLSVRALEAIVAREVNLELPKRNSNQDLVTFAKRQPPHPELEERLRNQLGTKVSIRRDAKGKGAIELHFFSDGELDRLVEILSRGE